MLVSTVVLSALTSLAAGPDPAAFEPGKPMVTTAANDVGWQVASPEEARAAFKERGELRCGPEKMAAHWKEHGPLYAEHGVTAFEPYVKWMLLEPKKGVWDPAFYDAELAAYKEHGLKWVPFLIAGPAYATPPWFKESEESVFAVDVATGDVSRDQSIWNPHLRPRVRAWLKRFFEYYAHEDMQSVLLGISGVFGESIYTAGGNLWTHIWDGEYPQHFGWWCGDRYAKADFAKTMRAKYEDIAALNTAWGTELTSFDEVVPFVPDDDRTMRARLDLVRWYMDSMTAYAEWWVATTRELAPDVPILLCTGGDGSAELGADMTGQTEMVARHGAGMRITNEASDYGTNFYLTRIIGTACRHYGTYFGYEPAGPVDTNGIVARVYNAAASGAWELFHYDNPPQGERGEQYKRHLDLMQIREPVVEVGFFWSRTSADLGQRKGLVEAVRAVRDICDVAFLDERLIADGALKDLKVFVWAAGPVTERHTAEVIRQAVKNGLTLVVPGGWHPQSPEGEAVFPSAVPAHPTAPVGSGAVVQSANETAESVADVLAALISDPAAFGVPGLSPEAAVDAKPDAVYVTVTTRDILLYNHGDTPRTVSTPAKAVEVPAHTIVSVPR
jgi:Beta-galactosidase